MNRIYAVSDLHGRYDLWQEIKNYIDETDKIYYLGDACDRGPDGIKLIMELLTDPQVEYICGNHEEFVIDYLRSYIQDPMHIYFEHITQIWMANGGNTTRTELEKLTEVMQGRLLAALNKLPKRVDIINKRGQNICLTHAGTSIDKKEKELKDRVHEGGHPYTWDREHFYEGWPDEKEYANWYVVHGHTPVQILEYNLTLDNRHLKNFNPDVYIYDEGHKIDIDLCTVQTNKVALFDLDNLKVEKYFTKEK